MCGPVAMGSVILICLALSDGVMCAVGRQEFGGWKAGVWWLEDRSLVAGKSCPLSDMWGDLWPYGLEQYNSIPPECMWVCTVYE